MGWTCCLCSYACLHEVEARQVIERQNIARNHRCWCSGIYMAVQGTDEGGLLPPHMDIKPLLFPVDNFICIGEWLACYTCCLCLNSAKQSLQTTEPKTMPWLGIGAGCEEVALYQRQANHYYSICTVPSVCAHHTSMVQAVTYACT